MKETQLSCISIEIDIIALSELQIPTFLCLMTLIFSSKYSEKEAEMQRDIHFTQ